MHFRLHYAGTVFDLRDDYGDPMEIVSDLENPVDIHGPLASGMVPIRLADGRVALIRSHSGMSYAIDAV